MIKTEFSISQSQLPPPPNFPISENDPTNHPVVQTFHPQVTLDSPLPVLLLIRSLIKSSDSLLKHVLGFSIFHHFTASSSLSPRQPPLVLPRAQQLLSNLLLLNKNILRGAACIIFLDCQSDPLTSLHNSSKFPTAHGVKFRAPIVADTSLAKQLLAASSPPSPSSFTSRPQAH